MIVLYNGDIDKANMSRRPKGFPYDHIVNEETKTIEIKWSGNGYIGRMGVPKMVNKYYPGYSFVFINERPRT